MLADFAILFLIIIVTYIIYKLVELREERDKYLFQRDCALIELETVTEYDYYFDGIFLRKTIKKYHHNDPYGGMR